MRPMLGLVTDSDCAAVRHMEDIIVDAEMFGAKTLRGNHSVSISFVG